MVTASTLGTHEPQLLHAESQRVWMNSQTLRAVARAVDPPVASLEHALDVRTLHGVEIVRGLGDTAVPRSQREGRVELQRVARRGNHRPLDHVLEFANV